MKAVEFKEQNIVFAKDQKEYESLPAHAQNTGMITSCFELTEEELKEIQKNQTLFITRLTFKGPVQPIKVNVIKPKFPVDHKNLTSDVLNWSEDGNATFAVNLTSIELHKLKKDKKIWFTTATFGAPLQPIQMTTSKPE